MENFIQVFCTIDKKEEAEKLATHLVKKRLAGCVQVIGPISSTYWWKNNIESSEEWLCLIKSKKNLFDKLEKAIKEVHSYETPEIIALPIIDGNKEYLKWLDNEVTSTKVKKLFSE